MKLVVEYEPQVFTFDIDDLDYADFLDSGESPQAFFDAYVSETEPDFSVKVVSLVG
jgi:hypothetical protein